MVEPRSRTATALAMAVAMAGAVSLGSGPGDAAESAGNVGAWDLKLQGGDRECRVMLRSEIVSTGYAVAMPVGCRRAFPILKAVALWTDPGDGRVQLDDSTGQPVMAFEPGPDGVLTGTSPEGEIYRLEQSGPHRDLTRRVAAAPIVALAPVTPRVPPAVAEPVLVPSAPPVQQMAALAAPPVVAPMRIPRTADLAGYFSVLREKTRDTGCMVTLDDKNHGPNGSLKAHLAPACRDQGIIIFDPVGWQLAGGRLVLTARKGHTAKFDLQPDGSWMKDPADGKSLSLKKM